MDMFIVFICGLSTGVATMSFIWAYTIYKDNRR